ncbi:MAG: ABC transporter ATP-binding protein [Candidatus Thiodiazotropha lotti]|uniref:Macrolide ABC transporter ATP-binding protein n=1 Tax=Candidatus Thiodiazotropha endoloripes TaxID=1818881 RepID=A0A1E2UKU5_9GAMM|nr:ABC transporter ATP-binding protein [Candidatus Thiodiazotropha endoloripes]MCG7898259.1 ABC transporter ATP-binding protein [Candidatus Thiodiazotropha weberae]MCG7992167.1 ABC transporter ATP-binding protein [Candidatus Thiodiazotropha lotti]MCG7903356.1 ABC transporter ATP-binding protein [Candidatus Thiodiazotropha weberae]MCG7915318.1 ABC transporter ATP-binding protein [Candidatus Thiodiazotropha weberae]MCG7998672.1 ABC transporter ATP-binding protein [Candidatus Thiodiazotropha lott
MIQMQAIHKSYWRGGSELPVIRGIDLNISAGEFVAIMGPSGSGKSTLMNIIGCLDLADRGDYRLNGERVSGAQFSRLAKLRGETIGFVFQSFNLIANRSALENVALPLLYQGVARNQRLDLATQALHRVGMMDRASHQPNQLSGGQQQRVAIARALVNRPSLLIADEPTGALDSRNGDQVLQLFNELHNEGHTLVMVTHDPVIGERADRVIMLHDGVVI